MTQPGHASFRVGLIGYGLAGAYFHAPFITTTPGLELSAIVTGNPDRQQLARRDYPLARICTATDELWSMADSLDLVVVAAPNAAHVPLARAAVRAKLPVIVDKPLAASAADARKLVDEARRDGVLLTVFQNRRFDGDFATVHRLLGEDQIGRPFRFESRFERWRPEPKPGWRESPAPEDAGGLLFDLGSHLIDQALLLFGPATHVYAEVDCRRPGVEVGDDVFVALTHDLGVRSHLWMSVVAGQLGPRFRLLGSAGTYVKHGLDVQEAALKAGHRPNEKDWGLEPESAWGQIEAGGSEPAIVVPTLPGDYGQFYKQMVAALRGERLPPVSPEDSINVLQVIEAARRSAAEKHVVQLSKKA
ncbi:MAG: Gfo/Idh/MocA family oxidoreductase [Vicinamibacterales bacterium]